MRWAWIVGGLHALIGWTLIFGTLHPLHDALDEHGLRLVTIGAAHQAIQGLTLLVIAQTSTARIAAALIAIGTALSCGMLYWMAFTGGHPFDAVVPVGGVITFLGWIALLASNPR
ncbi:MAG TPA: DUF423 domain-containing protein [Parvularculaceae bacterium]|nr:DUF423 domain-containing protein [Parvularculaceae bacterium]